MTKRPITNVAASARDRLLNRGRQTGEDFQFLLQRYAAERFLYRLGQSAHRARFVLKGAMLFALWGGSVYRPTRDLDFAGYGNSDADDVIATFREICAVPVPDDGLSFDAATVRAEPIRDEAEYNGLRVRLRATLGAARIEMQIDIGFGNAIEPGANDVPDAARCPSTKHSRLPTRSGRRREASHAGSTWRAHQPHEGPL
jgi:Nucleotidyl transferase AbiEii toxin, Type IV TA system